MKGRKFKVIKGGLSAESPWALLRRRLLHLALALGLSVIALVLMGRGGSFLVRALVSEHIVRSAPLETKIPFEGLILKTEHLIRTPNAGLFLPQVESGSRIRVGQVIGELESATGLTRIVSPEAGLLSYSLDGFELGFPRRDKLDLNLAAEATAMLDNPPAVKTITNVISGNPVAVVVKNSYIQVLGRVSIRPEGFRHLLQLQVGDRVYQGFGQVKDVLEHNGYTWFLWEMMDYDLLSAERVIQGQIILAHPEEAALLPSRAIVWKENKPGVLVQTRSARTFLEVTLVEQVGREVWVTGLASGQRVLVFSWGTGIIRWWWLR